MTMPKTFFEKKNILVTGGAGFIGSHLCEVLLKKNNKIICLDNFISGDERNIDHLLRDPNFEFIKTDVSQILDLEQFPELKKFKIKVQGIQEIYHLACPTSIKDFENLSEEILLANSDGVKNILSLAVKYKAKFLHTSSSVVYGPRDQRNFHFKEDFVGAVDPVGRRSSYDEGKRFAETLIINFQRKYNLDAKIARIFRTYGPRMRLEDGQMIPDFIISALEGRELVIYGDESFCTSLCYVSDIVDGLVRLMVAKGDLGPINLGSEEDFKIVEVAKTVIKMINSQSSIVFKEPLLFMTPLGLPNIEKAKEEIGWIPIVPLEAGLQKSIDYAKATKGLLGIPK